MRDWWAKGKGSTANVQRGWRRCAPTGHLAKAFQTRLYEMVFHDQDPSSYVRTMVDETRAGRHDDLLIYRKRLRQKLEEYQEERAAPCAGGAWRMRRICAAACPSVISTGAPSPT